MNHSSNKADPHKVSLRNEWTSSLGIADCDLRLEIFTTCDGANEQHGRLSLIGTFDSIGSPGFPFVLPSVTVVARLRFWPAEPARHHLRLDLVSPDGRSVSQPAEVEVQLLPENRSRPTSYNLIAHFLNLNFDEPGEYLFDLYLDGQIEGRLPFCVHQQFAEAF